MWIEHVDYYVLTLFIFEGEDSPMNLSFEEMIYPLLSCIMRGTSYAPASSTKIRDMVPTVDGQDSHGPAMQ